MEFIDPNQRQIPADIQESMGSEEDKARFAIPVLPRCEYVREKATGAVHKWNERFAERGDLLEVYEPSLQERINFGEDLMDLFNRGVTVEQMREVGVTENILISYGLVEDPNRAPPTQQGQVVQGANIIPPGVNAPTKLEQPAQLQSAPVPPPPPQT